MKTTFISTGQTLLCHYVCSLPKLVFSNIFVLEITASAIYQHTLSYITGYFMCLCVNRVGISPRKLLYFPPNDHTPFISRVSFKYTMIRLSQCRTQLSSRVMDYLYDSMYINIISIDIAFYIPVYDSTSQ